MGSGVVAVLRSAGCYLCVSMGRGCRELQLQELLRSCGLLCLQVWTGNSPVCDVAAAADDERDSTGRVPSPLSPVEKTRHVYFCTDRKSGTGKM